MKKCRHVDGVPEKDARMYSGIGRSETQKIV